MRKLIAMAACALLCAGLGLAAGGNAPRKAASEGVRHRPDAGLQMTGSMTKSKGAFFMTDEASKLVYEVRGAGLEKFVGKKVTIQYTTMTGQTPAAGAAQVVSVSQINLAGAAAGVGGKAAAAAGVKAGVSKAAVAGAVAAGGSAATVGSLYAADVIGSEEGDASRP